MSGIQDYLFRMIREKLPPNASIADVIAETLFISIDSAYRRIRGETPLVLEEAKILCDKFSISLDDTLNSKKNSVSVTFTQIDNKSYSFEKYLLDILGNLKLAESFQKTEIIYLTKDVPVFYNFLFKPLFSFRYFFWMKSILQHPDFIQKKFQADKLPPEIEKLGNDICAVYNGLPSIEIWNTECVNSTIGQIEYYREAGYFESEKDVGIIYNCLLQTIEHLRVQAEVGAKFLPGENVATKKNNFQFYYNRVILGDNTVLLSLEDKKILYLTYDALNYLIIRDEYFCNDAYAKLQTLMKRSTLLSNASDKQRNIFFNILLKKIPAASTYLNTLS
jgi:hypothetical protein